ncbi:hypothetical protein PoB_002974600 [Plakobranchus ocellatus]|uniref:MSP domain-containing protein n=1 Tax=Plakobranchus ocellatus TaxID=259542 RepID=A0AAV4A983_9GAST|nr:hypothetical protein PoB_002974600 [Plakobranchus ocellatus]
MGDSPLGGHIGNSELEHKTDSASIIPLAFYTQSNDDRMALSINNPTDIGKSYLLPPRSSAFHMTVKYKPVAGHLKGEKWKRRAGWGSVPGGRQRSILIP